MSITIVTAYYELPHKKYSSMHYSVWCRLYLKNTDANMIIFTDESSLPVLQEYRKNYLDKTKFVIQSLQSFYTYKFLEYWIKDHKRDHERYHHHPYLYMIWAEKSTFLKKAIDMNVYNSEFFCWTDIGMVREESQLSYINKFPNEEILKTIKTDKVYLLNIDEFTEQELKNNDVCQIFRYIPTARIGGGFILGHKDVLQKWSRIYYETLEDFMKKDYFAGKDQSIMACIYLKYRDELIELVRPKDSPINPWFYMLYYFGNRPLSS